MSEPIDPTLLTQLRQLSAAAIAAASAPLPPGDAEYVSCARKTCLESQPLVYPTHSTLDPNQNRSNPLPDVTLCSNAIPGSALRSYTAQGAFPLPMETLIPMLWQGAKRIGWDASYDSVTDVAVFSGGASTEELRLVRLVVKPVLIVSSRDFSMLQMLTRVSDTCVSSIGLSVADARIPPSDECVRGEVLPGSSWVLSEGRTPEGAIFSTLTYTIATDVKGWVPTLAVNSAVGGTLAKYFSQLATACGVALIAKAG